MLLFNMLSIFKFHQMSQSCLYSHHFLCSTSDLGLCFAFKSLSSFMTVTFQKSIRPTILQNVPQFCFIIRFSGGNLGWNIIKMYHIKRHFMSAYLIIDCGINVDHLVNVASIRLFTTLLITPLKLISNFRRGFPVIFLRLC